MKRLKNNKAKAQKMTKQNKKKGKLQQIFQRNNPFKAFSPVTNQQMISYMFKEYEGDIMRINDDGEYSICFEYEDISFAKADSEHAEFIFLKWVEFLNSFSEHTHIEVTNAGTPIHTNLYKKDFIFDGDYYTNKQQDIADELNELIGNAIGNKQDTLETKRYITISQKAKDFDEAKSIFFNMYMKTEEKFHELKSNIRIVSMNERLTFIHDFFNIHTAYDKGIKDFESYAKEHDLTIFDVIAPKDTISFRQSDYVESCSTEDKNKKKFYRVLYLNPKMPQSMTPKFYNMLTTLNDIHLITTLNIHPTNTAKIIKNIEKRLSGVETQRYNKIQKLAKKNINYEYVKDKKLETDIENLQKLLTDMTKNDQKVFNNNLLVCIIADTYDDLENATIKVQDKAGELLIKLEPIKWFQLEGIQHVLPLGHNAIPFQRTLTSEASAVNVPFNSKDFMHKKSIFYGINEVSKNGIFIDRKNLMNGNGCVLATSGAGKSFAVKLNVEQIFLRYPKDDIVIIDYQKEYRELVSLLNGQTVKFSNQTETHINPLDLDENYDLSEEGKASPIKTKIEYMQGWVESVLDKGKLTAIEKTLVDRCTNLIYSEYKRSGYRDKSKLPLLQDLYDCLKTQPEQEATEMAIAIERFVTGSLDIFSYKTNVNINNRVVCYDLSEIPKSIQTAGYLTILDHIMNRMAANKQKGKDTWVFIDEFHILLTNPSAAEYVAKIYKVGRKFGCFPTIITQNIKDVLGNEHGQKILGVSEFAMILKQKKSEQPLVCSLFEISPAEARYIDNTAKAGQGIIVYGSDNIPFYNHVPKNFLLYKINNTDRLMQSR